MPFASQTLVVYYNKAIFEEHGLEAPTTWDELIEVSDTLQDAGVTPFAVTGKDNWVLPMLHDLFAAPRYGGTEFEKAVLAGEKNFTDPDYVASLETLEELTPYFPDDVVGVDYADAQTLFTAEQAAMYPGGSFELAFFQDQNPDLEMGVFEVPPPPGALVDQSLTPGWVDASFGVNSESPDKEEALELVKWMSSQEFGQMVSDELKQLYPVAGVTPSDPLLEEMLENYKPLGTPYMLLVDFRYGEPLGSDLMAAGLQEMLLGDNDPAGVAEDVQKGVSQWFKPGALTSRLGGAGPPGLGARLRRSGCWRCSSPRRWCCTASSSSTRWSRRCSTACSTGRARPAAASPACRTSSTCSRRSRSTSSWSRLRRTTWCSSSARC